MADTTPTTAQRLAAEALGTFVLVLFGCGAFTYLSDSDTRDAVPVALTFGLTLVVLTFAFGRISGAHFNPAVTVGAAMGGRMPWKQVGAYVGAQLGGGLLGALALWVLFHGFDGLDAGRLMGANSFGDDGGGYAWWAALLIELLFTFLFVVVILAVTDSRNEHPAMAPLAIGFTLAAAYFVLLPFTGGSLNPVRSLAPAVFAGTDALTQVWLFIVAPLVGGALAGLAYPLLFGHGTEPVAGSGLSFAAPRPAAGAVPGYGAPDHYQQAWNQQQAAAEQAAWEAEPIIQDGWQWDHAAQEWKPLEQWQPAAPAQATPAAGTPSVEQTVISESTQKAVPQQPQQPGVQPPQQGWGDPNQPR
jgi:aquaporin Z